MKNWLSGLGLVVVLVCAIAAEAQVGRASSQPQFRGFNAYENFSGSVDPLGAVLKLDSSFGYDFNKNFGLFAGVPLYFAHDSQSLAGTSSTQQTALGDFYFGGELYVPNRVADYTSTVTIGAPTGNVADGFSTGHVTADWSNRFRKKIRALAPFAVAGFSNKVPDTETLTRGFSSLGKLLHFEEGAEYDLTRRVYVGASAYQVVPFGSQKIFGSEEDDLQPRDHGTGDPAENPNPAPAPGDVAPTATGNGITRENGFDAWIGFEQSRTVRTEIGYSRSITFAENRFSFNVSLNIGRIVRLRRSQ